MGKNILIISTSLRNNSNSEALADAFMEGAKSAGHQWEFILPMASRINRKRN